MTSAIRVFYHACNSGERERERERERMEKEKEREGGKERERGRGERERLRYQDFYFTHHLNEIILHKKRERDCVIKIFILFII